ncbi:hypothetical protein BH11MYX4_BH11MYX4_64470 [soil metagenome]
MSGERREKQTLIPAFDPEAMARELEAAVDRPTITPQFDPLSYARMVDAHVESPSAAFDTPRTMTAATPAGAPADATASESTTTIGRAMYGCYLSSDYPEALVLAERVLEREPEHALAQLLVDGCRERLGTSSEGGRLSPSSVVRLKRQPFELVELIELGVAPDVASQAVLDHVDGVSDVAMVAMLAGVPGPEALHRLHALLDLGLLEVVDA